MIFNLSGVGFAEAGFLFIISVLSLLSLKFIFPNFSNKIIVILTLLVIALYLIVGDPKIIHHLNKPAVKNQLTQWRKIRPTVFELQGQALQLQWDLKQNPDQAQKWHELGNILRVQGKLDAAKTALENSQKLCDININKNLQEDYFQCLNQLALRAYDLGEYEIAKKYWQEISNNTDNLKIKKNLDRLIVALQN